MIKIAKVFIKGKVVRIVNIVLKKGGIGNGWKD